MISAEFQSAVNGRNLLRTRIMLKDSMVVDPTMEQFNERFLYAKRKLPDLMMPHDGEAFEMDRSKWTTQILSMELVQLVNNFSQERLDYTKQMIQVLYAADAQKIAKQRKNNAEAVRRQKNYSTAPVSRMTAQYNAEKRKKLLEQIYHYGKDIERIMQDVDRRGKKFSLSEMKKLEKAADSLGANIRLYNKLTKE